MENETITQKQVVKDNVMIMKWLGHTLCQIKDCSSSKIEEEMRADWLSSPEGEVAMMDKLEELRLDIDNLMCAGKDRKRCICLYIGKLVPYGDRWRGTAKTRNAALRLAILKMLEGKK